ncbi:MAG: hypothetical protein WC975_13540 [Phycisphaerae bacterium]
MTQRNIRNSFITLVLFLGGPCLFAESSTAPAPSAAERYFNSLDQAIACSRSRISKITASAEQAAGKILAGGKIWVAGSQTDIISEACGRAGGLMDIHPLNKNTPDKNDIVLYGLSGKTMNDVEAGTLRAWVKTGTSVVVFSAALGTIPVGTLIGNCTSGIEGLQAHVDGNKKMYPVDTVANVINLWVWTGEFVAACTRVGNMPVLYQSIGLPDGYERIKKYTGKMFHDDMKIKSVAPCVLGRVYLDQIQHILASVRKTEMAKITQAADWWRDTPSDKVHILVLGHMFPQHFQDSRCPQKGYFSSGLHTTRFADLKGNPRLVLFVGYQYAPQPLADQSAGMHFKMVYSTVQPAKPANNVLYINPHWPLADGCVKVPGYDIPILPASGVIDAAIYWAILAQVCEK